ncbi:MAG: response regulator, partial [Thermoanaerobaculia bacterium]
MKVRAAPQPPAAPPAGELRVLIVDDNRDFAENIAELVVDLGHRAEVALTGREGVERFARAPSEVAIIDLQLPDTTGNRVIARLKEISPECVCIVFTGNAT